MNARAKIAAFILTAAATIGPVSAHAEPSPTITVPCTKTVAASWVGRGWATVKDASGNPHTVNAGYPQKFCPGWLYVPSGYDGQAWYGGTSVSGYGTTTWPSTGNHAFTSAQKSTANGTLWVKIY
jgi:hypothetical protein